MHFRYTVQGADANAGTNVAALTIAFHCPATVAATTAAVIVTATATAVFIPRAPPAVIYPAISP